MKKLILFIFSMITPFLYAPTDALIRSSEKVGSLTVDVEKQPFTINFYVHNENKTNNNKNVIPFSQAIDASSQMAVSEIASNNNLAAKTNQFVQNLISQNVVQSMSTKIQNTLTAITSNMNGSSLLHWLNHNRYSIIGCSLFASYLALSCYLIRENHYLRQNHLWSRWRNHLTLTELLNTPHKELQEQLLRDIQVRYINAQQPTDFLSPLMFFMRAIEEEERRISRYKRVIKIINWSRCSALFPINKKIVSNTRKQFNRLNFVKHMFKSWLAEHNVENILTHQGIALSSLAKCHTS